MTPDPATLLQERNAAEARLRRLSEFMSEPGRLRVEWRNRNVADVMPEYVRELEEMVKSAGISPKP